MKKLLLQGLGFLAIVAAIWILLSQVNFMELFNIETNKQNTEQKLGKLFWDSIRNSEYVIPNDSVNKAVKKIVTRIEKHNDFGDLNIKIHVIQRDDVNAFAMPGDRIILYSGLINSCKSEAELAGVIAHEMAHIKNRHVMKKMSQEIGFSVLFSLATGGQGGEVLQSALRVLSSSAYDRSMETEADLAAVDYLIDSEIDPAPFADFLYKMAVETDLPSQVYWISSHPESEERALEASNYMSDRKIKARPILSEKEWTQLKNHLK
ncbi:MAG: M48 family metallopeptidase [Flavobacterium sp.]|nr:M48 family metallopeptidase [Flavobacterium sp.]